ncbi:ABC transporter substrate-binding protein [Nocardioides caldifontis]|uniref:ABC transporter substrate-binding protein n=1 Tax=Nocardioides caldifontis TaxID=2588938 RepID=UPI0011E069B9|nr:spermidine/putrescine ABC transporter substrate-binding protein [Nocardioides caldifontis]
MPPMNNISRRDLLRLLGYGSLASAGVAGFAACSPPESEGTDSGSGGGGGDGELGSELTLATWPNYDDPELLEKFREETGVRVNVQVYGSTEEMETLLRAGNSGIDIAVPSQYAIPGWISSKLIQPLDYDKIDVDLSGWNKAVVDQEFDPGNEYTIPKHWGTTGMIYSEELGEEPTTWREFFELAGSLDRRATIVDHQISSIGSAAVALGLDFNVQDPQGLSEVADYLIGMKSKLFAISSDVQPGLRNGDSWLSIAWTGDGVQVVRDNPTFKYVIASDGGEIWSDNWSVAADAPHPEAAWAFLKFIHEPENAAANINFTLYAHGDPEVNELVDKEVVDNPVVYPDDDTIAPLSFATAETYNSPDRAKTWSRIKSS